MPAKERSTRPSLVFPEPSDMDPEPNPTEPSPPPSSSGVPGTVVVFTGGDPLPARVAALLPAHAYVIAADSGLEHALGLDRHVDLVVGDLDSVHPAVLDAAIAAGTAVERHPVAKDQTDLELALDRAASTGTRRIIVVGGNGGRLDHFLANILLLASPAWADVTIEALVGDAHVHVVRRELTFAGEPGELVTLLPAHGEAHGVRTEGLLYPLAGETLTAGSTRGVSNELAATSARVEVADGVLLVVLPGERGTHYDARTAPGDASATDHSPETTT